MSKTLVRMVTPTDDIGEYRIADDDWSYAEQHSSRVKLKSVRAGRARFEEHDDVSCRNHEMMIA